MEMVDVAITRMWFCGRKPRSVNIFQMFKFWTLGSLRVPKRHVNLSSHRLFKMKMVARMISGNITIPHPPTPCLPPWHGVGWHGGPTWCGVAWWGGKPASIKEGRGAPRPPPLVGILYEACLARWRMACLARWSDIPPPDITM
jgi:hypothetical protein